MTRTAGLFALVLCAACNRVGTAGPAAQQSGSIGTPQRIAGAGDIAQPRFAASEGLYLTVTDGGQPNLVFLVTAPTLVVEPVSFRLPPPGVPATPTAIGEFIRDLLVVPNDDSSGGSVTGTKNLAVFLSQASNLLEPGSGIFFFRDSTQAFLKDVMTGENFLVSADPDGLPANRDVTSVVISSDGRFVAFATAATNLYVPVNPSLAPNGSSQIYVLDLFTGILQLISITSTGAPANGSSFDPVITPDGRFVAFRSLATNLVPNDTNMTSDIFVYDRTKRTVARVSVDPGNNQVYADAREPVLSENGLFVAFTALNTVAGGPRQVWLANRSLGTVTLVSGNGGYGDDESRSPSITPDGQFVAFASLASNLGGFFDPAGVWDVFVYDGATAALMQASISTDGLSNGDGDSTQPSLSPDDNYIAYISRATNVADVDDNRTNSEPNGLGDLIIAPQPFNGLP